MDQVTKVMHAVSKMEKERLMRIIIISALLLAASICIFIYCGYMVLVTLEELGFGDLFVVLGESHEDFLALVGENLPIIGEFVEWGMVITLLLSIIFFVFVLVKTDLPSLPKRLKETKKY